MTDRERLAAPEPCPSCGAPSLRYCHACGKLQDSCTHNANYDRRAVAGVTLAPRAPEERRSKDTEEKQDTWWLIERPSAPTPIWWTGGPDWDGATPLYPWTSDPNRAKKFPTKAAAEAAIEPRNGIKGIHEPYGVATEHIWLWRGDDPSYVGYQERAARAPSEAAPPEADPDTLTDELPLDIRGEFRDAVQTLSNARRAEAWDALFKAVRWGLNRLVARRG